MSEARKQIKELSWKFDSNAIIQMQKLEDELFNLNQKHRFLDYLEVDTLGVDIKEVENQDLGQSTH